MIARGVYPAVLRDQGPAAALDEVIADLPRTVRLTGEVPQRLAWEVESGIYYLAAAAVTHLGDRPARTELHVHLEHRDGRLAARVDDPELGPGSAAALRAELAGDIERLAALGGDVEVTEYAAGVTVRGVAPGPARAPVGPARSDRAGGGSGRACDGRGVRPGGTGDGAGARAAGVAPAARVALGALLVLCTAVSLSWLVLGAVAAAAQYVPAVARSVGAAAAAGSTWARAVAGRRTGQPAARARPCSTTGSAR